MEHSADVLRAFFCQDGNRVLLGLARMDDDGQCEFPGESDLLAEVLTLLFRC
jgi:hypothetical protein